MCCNLYSNFYSKILGYMGQTIVYYYSLAVIFYEIEKEILFRYSFSSVIHKEKPCGFMFLMSSTVGQFHSLFPYDFQFIKKQNYEQVEEENRRKEVIKSRSELQGVHKNSDMHLVVNYGIVFMSHVLHVTSLGLVCSCDTYMYDYLRFLQKHPGIKVL